MPKIPADKILEKFNTAGDSNWPQIRTWFNEKASKWGTRKYTHKWLKLQVGAMREWVVNNWDRPDVQRRATKGWIRFIKNWISRQVVFDEANRKNIGGHALDREKQQERRSFKPIGDILKEIQKRGMK